MLSLCAFAQGLGELGHDGETIGRGGCAKRTRAHEDMRFGDGVGSDGGAGSV